MYTEMYIEQIWQVRGWQRCGSESDQSGVGVRGIAGLGARVVTEVRESA